MSLGSVLIDTDRQSWLGKRQGMNNFLFHCTSAPVRQRVLSFVRQWLMALLLIPVVAQALPDDRQQPINISSDTADLDTKEGISVYRGDVVVTQGTTQITGDIVTVYTSGREVSQVIAVGEQRLAYYEEQQSEDLGTVKAWGETIRYDVNEGQIELIKEARLTQKGDIFTGEKIDYNLTQQTVNARGASEQGAGGRVQMVLQPRQKGEDSAP